jgi:hypothetical protein
MKTDIYGQQIFTENEVCELYLSNPDIKIQSILVDTDITVDAELELNNIP